MIRGLDLSMFQGEANWDTLASNTEFVIAKASEGSSFIDSQYGYNRLNARSHNVPFGSYHFARADLGNSPQAEATFFCSLIDGDPIRVGEVLALDFEVIYNDPVGWSKIWLDTVSKHYNGIKPVIYMNQATAQGFDWTPVISESYSLWIAAYTYDPNNNTFQGGKWQTAAFQQWTDKLTVAGITGVVDGDLFFGDVPTFKKYGYQLPPPPPPPPDPCASYKLQLSTLQDQFDAYKLAHPEVTVTSGTAGTTVSVQVPTVPEAMQAISQAVSGSEDKKTLLQKFITFLQSEI